MNYVERAAAWNFLKEKRVYFLDYGGRTSQLSLNAWTGIVLVQYCTVLQSCSMQRENNTAAKMQQQGDVN